MPMIIGVPKEIKPQEGRVALMPEQVKQLVGEGYNICIEKDAGSFSQASNDEYIAAGANMMNSINDIYEACDFIVKVKEFMPEEYSLIREEHVLLTNIHSAGNRELTDILLEKNCTAIAAEDTHQFGSPNCALAGEIGAFEGIRLCFAYNGGTGRHFYPHFGSPAMKVAVIGLGNVGRGTLRVLLSLGCDVTGFDISDGIIYRTEQDWDSRNFTATKIDNFSSQLPEFDLVINCVIWPKHRNDHLISREDLVRMKKTAVICDISCDEGGAVETCRATNWQDPTYKIDGITHFCVDNIPGSVPVAASSGYGRTLLVHIRNIMENGWKKACINDPYLARGLVCHNGILIHEETGKVQNRMVTNLHDFLID